MPINAKCVGVFIKTTYKMYFSIFSLTGLELFSNAQYRYTAALAQRTDKYKRVMPNAVT